MPLDCTNLDTLDAVMLDHDALFASRKQRPMNDRERSAHRDFFGALLLDPLADSIRRDVFAAMEHLDEDDLR